MRRRGNFYLLHPKLKDEDWGRDIVWRCLTTCVLFMAGGYEPQLTTLKTALLGNIPLTPVESMVKWSSFQASRKLAAEQESKWSKELRPFLGRLEVHIIDARDILPALDPYIVCIYDHSELVGHSKVTNGARVSKHDRSKRRLETLPPRTQPGSFPSASSREQYSWDIRLSFDVRDVSLPLDIAIFGTIHGQDLSQNPDSDSLLGRVRFVPSYDSTRRSLEWIPLRQRNDTEKPVGMLQVSTCFIEGLQEFTFGDFRIQEPETGNGGYGLISKRDNGLVFATKSINLSEDKEAFHKNGRASGFVRPVKFALSDEHASRKTIAVDYAGGGTLFQRLHVKGSFDEATTRFYAAEIILTLEDLLECDPKRLYISNENLLLDGFGHVTFRDFGVSPIRISHNIADEKHLEYMAPELIQHAKHTWSTNLWSLGVLIYEMCYGLNPFWTDNPEGTAKSICFGNIRYPEAASSSNRTDLMKRLLDRSPQSRIGATRGTKELKSHPFFTGIDWERLRNRDVIPPFKPPLRVETPYGQFPENESQQADHELMISGGGYESPLSYQTMSIYTTPPSHYSDTWALGTGPAGGSFPTRSIYATPASYADIWALGSGPSGEGVLNQLFAVKEEELPRSKIPYTDLVRNRGLLLPVTEELDWSGQGQHVEFGVGQDVPLKALNALGHGGMAMVDSVMCRRIKLARKTMLCSRRQKLETMITEVEHLQRLRHPHIVQLVGSYLQGKSFAILLYPVAEWNLASFLELCEDDANPAARTLKIESLPRFLQCLTHALAHIHENTIKHMDIKPQNVLVRTCQAGDGKFRVYLADFGISKNFAASELSQTDGGMAGTRKYCAPEVYEEELRGRSADVFSLGCVFLEMVTVFERYRLDEFTEYRSHAIDPKGEEWDSSFQGNLDKVSAWIDKLSKKLAPCFEPARSREEGMTLLELGVVSRMLSRCSADRPTAARVLTLLGGARNCCVQKREVYEIEQGET